MLLIGQLLGSLTPQPAPRELRTCRLVRRACSPSAWNSSPPSPALSAKTSTAAPAGSSSRSADASSEPSTSPASSATSPAPFDPGKLELPRAPARGRRQLHDLSHSATTPLLQPIAVLDVLMADDTNPRSLDFQLDHLVEPLRQTPAMPSQTDLEGHRNRRRSRPACKIDLQATSHPSAQRASSARSAGFADPRPLPRPDSETLLPSWSNNLSSHYFSHARTLPISMGFD